MSEERMARMEAMIGDLIRIVGNTNSLMEEIKEELDGLKVEVKSLRTDVDELKVEVKNLRTDVDELKVEVKNLRTDVDELKVEVKNLRTDVDELKAIATAQGNDVEIIKAAMATKDDIALLNERFDYLSERILRQEEDTYRLKRLIGIK